MANIFDYLSWRGDLTFEHSPFNPVDNIILSQLVYLSFDGIVPGPDKDGGITLAQAADIYAKKQAKNNLHGPVIFKEDPLLLDILSKADRYKNCKLYDYVNQIDIVQEKQFAALCIDLGASTFIAYRGTDVSVVGWKEDFKMSISVVIPAQIEAVSYLEKAASKTTNLLMLGGHSKGGNLAIYAASSCAKEIQNRIAAIYSNDSPGFHGKFFESDGYREVCQRIYSFVPQTSVIGLLFEHGNDYAVVKSKQKGILQHDLYTWEVTHNDLIRLDQVDQGSRFINKTLREWINSLDDEHIRVFSDTLFGVINDAEITSFTEFGEDWLNATGRVIQSYGHIDSDTKKNVGKVLSALFKAATNNINTLLPENTQQVQNKKDKIEKIKG
jgi:hypothetical protein